MKISQMLANGKNVEAYWESGPEEMYEGVWNNLTAAMVKHGNHVHVGVLKAVVTNGVISINGDLAAEDVDVSFPDIDIGKKIEYRVPIHSDLGDGEILLNAE